MTGCGIMSSGWGMRGRARGEKRYSRERGGTGTRAEHGDRGTEREGEPGEGRGVEGSSRLSVHGSRFTIRSSWFTLHDSQFTINGSRFAVHGSRFTIHGLQFTVHDSQIVVHDSQFTVPQVLWRLTISLDCPTGTLVSLEYRLVPPRLIP